jgi:phage gp29-like protein
MASPIDSSSALKALAAQIARSYKGNDPVALEQMIANALSKLDTERKGTNINDEKKGPPRQVDMVPDPNAKQELRPKTPNANDSPMRRSLGGGPKKEEDGDAKAKGTGQGDDKGEGQDKGKAKAAPESPFGFPDDDDDELAAKDGDDQQQAEREGADPNRGNLDRDTMSDAEREADGDLHHEKKSSQLAGGRGDASRQQPGSPGSQGSDGPPDRDNDSTSDANGNPAQDDSRTPRNTAPDKPGTGKGADAASADSRERPPIPGEPRDERGQRIPDEQQGQRSTGPAERQNGEEQRRQQPNGEQGGSEDRQDLASAPLRNGQVDKPGSNASPSMPGDPRANEQRDPNDPLAREKGTPGEDEQKLPQLGEGQKGNGEQVGRQGVDPNGPLDPKQAALAGAKPGMPGQPGQMPLPGMGVGGIDPLTGKPMGPQTLPAPSKHDQNQVILLRPPDVPEPPPPGEIGIADTRRGMALGFNVLQYNDDDLVQKKGMRVYDDMRKDEQVKACLLLKKCAIIGPGWDIEPTDNHADAALQLALEVKEDLQDMHGTFNEALMAMLTAFDYGFSISEKVWENDVVANRLKIRAIKTRAPHDIDFELDPHGNVTGLLQQQGMGQLKLPYCKFIHLAYRGDFSNPYGRSDLREAYRSYWHKQNFLQWWAAFAEKLSDPPLVAMHPLNAGRPQIDKLMDVLTRMQSRTAMAVPEKWEVKLLETARDPRAMFESAINHHDLAIAKALLVPDKSGYAGGETSGGSYALSQTQFAAFTLILEMTARWLEANVQEQLINQMVLYNYGEDAKPPRFVILPMSGENKAQIAQLWISAISGNAVMPDFDDEQHLRNLLQFPEKDERERAKWEMEKMQQQQQQLAEKQAMADASFGGSGDGDDKGDGDKDGLPNEHKGGIGGGGLGNGKPGLGSKPGDAFKAFGGNPFGGHTNPLEKKPKTFSALVRPSESKRTKDMDARYSRPLTDAEERADLGEKLHHFERYTPPVSQALMGGVLGLVADLKRQVAANPKMTPEDIRQLKPDVQVMTIAQRDIEHALASAYTVSKAAAEREVSRAMRHFTDLRNKVKGDVELVACDMISAILSDNGVK